MTGAPTSTASARQAAVEWAARIEAGAMDDDAWAGFSIWISEPAHEAAFEAAQRRLGLIDQALTQAGRTRASVRQAPSLWRAVGAGGAVAMAIGLAVFLTVRPAGAPTQTFDAGAETREIALADHSAVSLRPGSHMTAAFTKDRRAVALAAGSQASFDVAKDPARPFVIALGAKSVRVVGTAFDIAYRQSFTRVSVARGVVDVTGGVGGESRRLIAGQTVTIPAGAGPWVDSRVRPENVGAWRRQRLIFDNASLDQVASEIADAADVPVSTAPSAGRLRFTGVLKLGKPEQIARTLETYLPVRAHVSGGRIQLDRKGAS